MLTVRQHVLVKDGVNERRSCRMIVGKAMFDRLHGN